jgi:peptidyl-prolyl cis-trans isomerase B (cyclophilin B)
MKLKFATAALLLLSAALAQAEEVALMKVRIGRTKELLPVAITFYEAEAPMTVANFKKLARRKFYDGCTFHRAFPHTLVQVGDPLSKKRDRTKVGTGGPGYTLLPEVRRRHGAGDIAMARLPDKLNPGRMSNGSQFFVCIAPLPSYDGQYTVFAHVLYGLDTLDRISQLPVDSNDAPLERVKIDSLRVMPREQLPPEPVPSAPKPVKKKAWWRLGL